MIAVDNPDKRLFEACHKAPKKGGDQPPFGIRFAIARLTKRSLGDQLF
jgi:hypothetical protein